MSVLEQLILNKILVYLGRILIGGSSNNGSGVLELYNNNGKKNFIFTEGRTTNEVASISDLVFLNRR